MKLGNIILYNLNFTMLSTQERPATLLIFWVFGHYYPSHAFTFKRHCSTNLQPQGGETQQAVRLKHNAAAQN